MRHRTKPRILNSEPVFKGKYQTEYNLGGTSIFSSRFSDDGTKWYQCWWAGSASGFPSSSRKVTQFNLSTPFDLSTIISSTLSPSVLPGNGFEPIFVDNGNKMYVTRYNSGITNSIQCFNLSTPFDISTATLHSTASISVTNKCQVSEDGTKLIIRVGTSSFREYTFQTPYDLTTLILENTFTTPNNLSFEMSKNGRFLYIMFSVNNGTTRIAQYFLYDVYSLNNPILVKNCIGFNTGSFLGFSFSPNGKRLFITTYGTLPQITEYNFETSWMLPDELEFEPNTFVGNVGDLYPTATNFAASLGGLNVNTMRNYKIDDNNNISFHGTLVFDLGAFSNSPLIYQNGNITFFISSRANRGSSSIFRSCASLKHIELTAIGDMNFSYVSRGCPNMNYFKIPNARITNAATFYEGRFNRLFIPFSNRIGINTSQESVFYLIPNTGLKIYVNKIHETSLNGGIEGDLLYAIGRNADVRFFEQGIVNVVNDLTPDLITNNSVQLNFTAPTSDFNLDFYEVWVKTLNTNNIEEDLIPKQEIVNSGDILNNLSPDTDYEIYIVACDIFWNRSLKSNTITIKTLI